MTHPLASSPTRITTVPSRIKVIGAIGPKMEGGDGMTEVIIGRINQNVGKTLATADLLEAARYSGVPMHEREVFNAALLDVLSWERRNRNGGGKMLEYVEM